ncbi:MAG: ArsR family transcriptional regulator [Euryarchaeota archaeon]|nr:ArsR family transcriptional regulator [Euryarchaeota archaeon]
MQIEDTRAGILDFLRRRDASVDGLSSKLGISSTATRQHLAILERDSLIKRIAIKEKMGRPKIFYSLTERAEKFFPKAYSDFFKWIIRDIIEREGSERVREMMARLGAEQASYYKERLKGDGVVSVVELLNELGTFAEMEREDGQIIIKEYNCLIYEIAMEFGDVVCEFNLNFIGGLLNSSVELKSCIARGDRCCSFALNHVIAQD